MAVRDPERFIALAHQGPHIFADAVLLAEGRDPADPRLRRSACDVAFTISSRPA